MPAYFGKAKSRQPGFAVRLGAPSVVAALIAGLPLATMANNTAATMTTEHHAGPPAQYRIDDVTVRVLRQPGMRKVPLQRVTLPGSGDATLERDGAVLPFSYPQQKLLGVLDELYRIRFFEMPVSYTPRRSAVLRDDGTVLMQVQRMHDAPSTSVCVAIGSFEKCVTYGADAPVELKAVEHLVFADAARLLPARANGK